MIFVADESLDGPVVRSLRDLGHQVLFIAESEPGIPDFQVLARAFDARAILLTADKDFGDLIFRQNHPHFGVILLRLSGLTPAEKAPIVARHVATHGTDFEMAFSVITARTVRIRQTKH